MIRDVVLIVAGAATAVAASQPLRRNLKADRDRELSRRLDEEAQRRKAEAHNAAWKRWNEECMKTIADLETDLDGEKAENARLHDAMLARQEEAHDFANLVRSLRARLAESKQIETVLMREVADLREQLEALRALSADWLTAVQEEETS